MAEITGDQSIAEIDELIAAMLTAQTLAPELADDQPVADALLAAIHHPCANHQVEVGELHAELAEIHRGRGDHVDAIAAWEAAIAAGLRSRPHPRAHVGRELLEVDRDAEAEKLYTQLLDDHPDDAWLCWVAGLAYDDVIDDSDGALRWVDRGIEIALATSDSDDALGELLESRADLLSERGLDVTHDDLGARAAAFVRPAGPPPDLPDYGDHVDHPESCDYCGWHAAGEPANRISLADLRRLRAALGRRDRHAVGRQMPATSTKLGRNEPCPCSSGQKYKHCHGR